MLQYPSTSALDDDFPKLNRDPQAVNMKQEQPQGKHADVLAQIDRLEEMILDHPRVPLTGKTMVNEEELIEQIDAIRFSIPEALKMARAIIDEKDRLLREAQQQAQQIIAAANQRAYQVANELGIIDRAEQEARQIRQMAIAEGEHLKQQTMAEVERLRTHTLAEIEQMRQEVIAECQEIQTGADEYADRVLHQIENQLNDMLQVIQRGRSRLKDASES